MAAFQTLDTLQARKRDLLVVSDINRQMLQSEMDHIRFRMEQIKHNWLSRGWKWAAPVAGFLFARKFKKTGGMFAKSSLALLLLRTLWAAWLGRKG